MSMADTVCSKLMSVQICNSTCPLFKFQISTRSRAKTVDFVASVNDQYFFHKSNFQICIEVLACIFDLFYWKRQLFFAKTCFQRAYFTGNVILRSTQVSVNTTLNINPLALGVFKNGFFVQAGE